MTSPDRLPIGAYNPQSPPIGDWDFPDFDLAKLGENVIFGPIRSLLSIVTGDPEGTWPDLGDIIGGAQGFFGQIDTLNDGQLDLKGRVDLLSPLEDYGAAYAPGQGEILNTGKVPFNLPIGPMKGCHLSSNGIVLEQRGLWKVDARLAFGFTVAPGGGAATWEVRVIKDATGEVFMNRIDKFNTTSEETRQLSFPVVVPAGGYRVEVRITTLIIGRGMKGGPAWNGLSCHHLSHSTDNIVGN